MYMYCGYEAGYLLLLLYGWSRPRAMTGIMHGHNSGTWHGGQSPQLSANVELQLGTNGTDTTMYLICGGFCWDTSCNCPTAGCSKHIPGAYLELVFAPSFLHHLTNFRRLVQAVPWPIHFCQCSAGLAILLPVVFHAIHRQPVKVMIDKREGFDPPPLSRTLPS